VLYQKGQEVEKVAIDKGEVKHLPLVAADTVGILMKKGEKKDRFVKELVLENVAAPVKKGQIVGQVVIKQGTNEVAKVDLIAAQDVQPASMWQLFKRTVESWMTFGG
jgi:D-alanyl-D-alanine carboxypeptidase (penicillin-binding protein 5/6)